MDGKYYNLWSTDNERTDANDEVVIKSVYDPSPVGYSLPASNAFTGFTTTGQNVGDGYTPFTPEQLALLNVKGSYDKGWYFYTKPNKQGENNFFSAGGFRLYSSGSMLNFSASNYYWDAEPISHVAGRLLYLSYNYINPISDHFRSHGFCVRSAEEKVLKCGLKKLQIVYSFGENCNITTLKIRILLYKKT